MRNLISVTMLMLSIFSCSPDCKDDVASYDSGYSAGRMIKSAGSGTSCSEYASGMNEQGFNVDANSCFCDGFSDGKSGSENKYEKE